MRSVRCISLDGQSLHRHLEGSICVTRHHRLAVFVFAALAAVVPVARAAPSPGDILLNNFEGNNVQLAATEARERYSPVSKDLAGDRFHWLKFCG